MRLFFELDRFTLFSLLFDYLFVTQKKLFELPVERDFANEKAFNAAQYPFLFQIFLRIRFFELEVRFFGTAIFKLESVHRLDVKDIYCSKSIVLYYISS